MVENVKNIFSKTNKRLSSKVKIGIILGLYLVSAGIILILIFSLTR
jgi:hypothetical protein